MKKTGVYLVKSSSGIWHIKYQTSRGNWTHKSTRTTKKAEAQLELGTFLKEREERQLRFHDIELIDYEPFTIEYLEYANVEKAFLHFNRQRQMISNFMIPFFGAKTLLTDITPKRIDQYKNWRSQTIKNVSVNRELACLSHQAKKAMEWHYLLTNPMDGVKFLPHDGQERERFLKKQEYHLMLETALKRRQNADSNLPTEPFPFLYELVVLGVGMGFRVSELLFSEFSDVDFHERIITVRNKPHLGFTIKNYLKRYVPLTDHVYDVLVSMRERKHPDSDFIFHKSDGSRYLSIKEAFRSLVKECGLLREQPFNVTPHTMRHTFASWLASEGVALRTIQKLMGHKYLSTTERYAHLFRANRTTAIEILGNFAGNELGKNSLKKDKSP